LNCDLEALAGLLPPVEELLDRAAASPEARYVTHLVLEELLTNVIRHGSGVSPEGGIRVALTVSDDRLCLEIRDDGEAFDPRHQPSPEEPDSLGEARVGGLGLHLVREMVESLAYRRGKGTNEVTVRIPLKGGSAPQRGSTSAVSGVR
jgi:anti-sigma regulatory factor (Ser/Thr protein kinase)